MLCSATGAKARLFTCPRVPLGLGFRRAKPWRNLRICFAIGEAVNSERLLFAILLYELAVARVVAQRLEIRAGIKRTEAVSYTHLDVYKRQVLDKLSADKRANVWVRKNVIEGAFQVQLGRRCV